MSVLSTKRPHFALDDPSYTGLIDLPFHGPKRIRTAISSIPSQPLKEYSPMDLSNVPNSPPLSHIKSPRQSPHPQHRSLLTTLNKSPSPTLRSRDLSAYKARLFTWEEMNRYVASALKEREEVLKREYERVLQDKLAEQFESFTQFNQDYIHRQMKESNFDYMA